MSERTEYEELEKVLSWEQPSKEATERFLSLFRFYFSPTFHGTENLDATRPTMYVANHSLYSLADPVLMIGIYDTLGEIPRGLADRLHFRLPFYRDFVGSLGAVVGDRELVRGMMRAGQSIVVFPGGTREVMKKRHEGHRLVWKQRTGFVRLAVEMNYTITPVGVAGGDDCFDVVADADDYMNTLIGKWIHRSGFLDRFFRGRDELPPIVRGMGFSVLPKPVPIHVSYGKPIDVAELTNGSTSDSALFAAREEVAKQIDLLVEQGLAAQEKQKGPSLLRRLLVRS